MDKVVIKNIKIRNFKGIASLNYDFSDEKNVISGPNGSGKSTIKNAWEWCLCQGVEDYIPMLNNREIPNLTTSVELTLTINNIDYKLTRESSQKTSSRGRENKLVYKIDDIEIQKNVYVQKITDIMSAGTFENLPLLTDKDYFNTDTTKWKWADRRKLLLRLSGADEKCKDLLENEDYSPIREYILKGFETSDIQSSITKEKKDLNKAQQDNITRITTKHEELDEYLSIDFDTIKKELATTKTKLTKLINEPVSDTTKEISDSIYKLSQELDSLQAKDALTLSELKKKKVDKYNEAIEAQTHLNLELPEEVICPNCKTKVKFIGGVFDKKEMEEIYDAKRNEYKDAEYAVDNFKPNPRIADIENDIKDLKLTLEQTKDKDAEKSRSEEINNLSNRILSLELELSKMTLLQKGQIQIKVWKDDNKDIADKLIKVEEKEMALQDYVKAQAKIISDSVNSMFGDDISWSLFNENYNGSIEQDCICLYKGKRYSSLSAGEKNKVNIEVTATLQKLFNVSLPMFCDNAEGMTLPVENVDSQLIWLVATKDEANIKATKITDLY